MYVSRSTKLQLPPATPPHRTIFRRNGMIQRFLIRPGLIVLRTKIIGVPTIGLPAVIPLRFSIITTICS